MAVVSLANTLLDWWTPDVTRPKYQALYGGAVRYGTLLLGTSHVFHCVDPRVLEGPGRGVFNLGVDAGNPSYFHALYRDLRRFGAVPGRLLLGLDPLLLKRFPWSHRYGQDSGYWPWGLLVENLVAGADDRGVMALNRWALVRHRDAVQDAVAGVRPRAGFVHERAYRGFIPLVPDPHLGPEGTTFPDDPPFVADLGRLFEDFKADGVKVTCFQTPEYLPSTGDHHDDNARLGAIARAHGCAFLDYNGDRRSAINTDPALFNDGGHLNVLGCDRFTPVLRRDLEAMGAL